ncbi:MAG: nucleoside recognition domain-containing protein [Lachnospiraceae bacterium]
MSQVQAIQEKKPQFMNSFIGGAKKGVNLVLNVVVPNVVFSFALTRILELSGIIDILGSVLGPIMAIFGLPGEASVPMVIAILSMTSGVTSTAALCASGVLASTHALILLPFIFLAGSLLTYTGRVLAVTGLDTKHYKICYIIALINGFLSLIVMRLITLTLGI